MPMTMPRYEAELSTCAASAMTTPIAPGPDISGIARVGQRNVFSFVLRLIALCSGVMRAWEV